MMLGSRIITSMHKRLKNGKISSTRHLGCAGTTKNSRKPDEPQISCLSPDGREGSSTIRSPAVVCVSARFRVSFSLGDGRAGDWFRHGTEVYRRPFETGSKPVPTNGSPVSTQGRSRHPTPAAVVCVQRPACDLTWCRRSPEQTKRPEADDCGIVVVARPGADEQGSALRLPMSSHHPRMQQYRIDEGKVAAADPVSTGRLPHRMELVISAPGRSTSNRHRRA